MFPMFKIQFLRFKIYLCAKFAIPQRTSSNFVKKWLSTNLLTIQRPQVACIKWRSEGPTESFKMEMDGSRLPNFIYAKNVVKAVVKIEIEGWLWNSTGSGFIINSDGFILTNAHVVQRNRQKVLIKLYNGEIYHGIVKYFDSTKELAVVKINASNLPVLKFADSNECEVGQTVIAIGGPHLSEKNATSGNISHMQTVLVNRELFDYIQTDAAITETNNGGPLVNLDGEVVGINIRTKQSGISFAIPSFYAKEFLENVVDKEWKRLDKKKWKLKAHFRIDKAILFPTVCEKLGLTVVALDVKDFFSLDPGGSEKLKKQYENIISRVFLVDTVSRKFPADNACLCRYDLIIQIDNKPIRCIEELVNIAHKKDGSYLTIFRNNDILPVFIQIINPKVDKDK